MSRKKDNRNPTLIVRNKRASFDYQLKDKLECGIVLEGWEVKAMRAGKARIAESYVYVKDGELFISGMSVEPLASATRLGDGISASPNPSRIRKLLAKKKDIFGLIGAVERDGYTLVATKMYWSNSFVKVEVALAKGKKNFDKRASEKERDWGRQKDALAKVVNR